MPALSFKLPPLSRIFTSLLDCPFRGQLPHVHLAHLDDDGVVHDAVHDGFRMRAGTHAAMPVLVGILRAVDGRGVVVAKVPSRILRTFPTAS